MAKPMAKAGRKKNSVVSSPRMDRAFELFVERLKEGNFKNYKDIFLEAGYSPSTARASAEIRKTDAWKRKLEELDDSAIVDKWQDWATDDDPKTRGSNIKAGELVLKLKNRFPREEQKRVIFEKKLSDIYE
jgi:hypothetical protein